MSRCKSCDIILDSREMSREKPDGSNEDLCRVCSRLVFLDVEDLFVDDFGRYAFGDITELPYNQVRGVYFRPVGR